MKFLTDLQTYSRHCFFFINQEVTVITRPLVSLKTALEHRLSCREWARRYYIESKNKENEDIKILTKVARI